MVKYKVLSTKKLDPLLIEKGRQEDVEIVELEFITINPIWSEKTFNQVRELHRIPFVVFTSQNAVTSVSKFLDPIDSFYVSDWKIFCLSGSTRQAIVNAGWEKNIIDTADHAAALAKKIIDHKSKEVIFFCADVRRDELPDILKEAGIVLHEAVVYQTIETPMIVTDNYDAILFFSPSAVKSFFSVNQLKEHTVCFVIGQTTAGAVADFTGNKIIISTFPSAEMLLTLMFKFLKT